MIWRAKKNDSFESEPHWYVLMVRCVDGSLCTEVTSGVDEGVRRINEGLGMPYTRSRLPVFAVHSEEYMNESDAQSRAAQIRSLTKPQKERMVADLSVQAMERAGRPDSPNTAWRALSDMFR